MIINCTKKLQDELGIKPELVNIDNPLFSWHANIIKINRRKTLVLINDISRYSIVLYGLKAKDFKNLEKLIYDEIYKTFENDCINREIISNYLEDAGKITFSKTQNRTQVARMNKGCEAVEIYSESIKEGSISQLKISKQVNNYPLLDYNGEYKYPNEVLYNELENMYNKPAVSCKAVKLKIKLDFEKVDISRTVVLPLNYTFREFHRAMQLIFQWENYHLHRFEIYENDKKFVEIVGSKEDFDYKFDDVDMVMDDEVLLSDYLPKYKKIKYIYDYGDNWVHVIEIEDVLFDYDKNHAYCLSANRDSPPEDIGGEWGYYEYLKVLKDETHEYYNSMKKLSQSIYNGKLDIELVNKRLKSLW